MNWRNELWYEQLFYGAYLSSNDVRVKLKYDASEFRLKCLKFEKTVAISLFKSEKLILLKRRNIDKDFWAIGFEMSRSI